MAYQLPVLCAAAKAAAAFRERTAVKLVFRGDALVRVGGGVAAYAFGMGSG